MASFTTEITATTATYVSGLFKKYEQLIDYLRTNFKNIIIEPAWLDLVARFSDEQNGIYDAKYNMCSEPTIRGRFNYHHMDDLLEILVYYMYIYKRDDLSDADCCVYMHDAWALQFLLQPKWVHDENGNETFDSFEYKFNSCGGKNIVVIQLDPDQLPPDQPTAFPIEERRIAQLQDFAPLSDEEKVKDLIPLTVCRKLCTNKVLLDLLCAVSYRPDTTLMRLTIDEF
jgi:hypothetical protein